MSCKIHPTALISAEAEISDGVEIGPYCVVSGRVRIGEATSVGPHTVIQGPAVIGKNNRIFGQCALGTDPQDLKYQGEESWVVIGDGNRIREFVTVNRGTSAGTGKTVLGSNNLLMTGVHVAHDCEVGDNVILVNAATLAGHVEVGDCSTVGAFTGVHQYCRVGRHAFIGGYSVVTRDALPFVKTVGARNGAAIFGINSVGLQRRGFSPEEIKALQAAYRTLFLRKLRLSEAIQEIRSLPSVPDCVEDLLQFIESAKRGFIRTASREEE